MTFKYSGSVERDDGRFGTRTWFRTPFVRGFANDLRNVDLCESGRKGKKWWFRKANTEERLSTRDTRESESGAAGKSWSLCSGVPEASVVGVVVIESGCVRT